MRALRQAGFPACLFFRATILRSLLFIGEITLLKPAISPIRTAGPVKTDSKHILKFDILA